jgi:hypothetical protein
MNRIPTLLLLFTVFALKGYSGSGIDSTSKKIFFSVDYRNSFVSSSDAHVIGFRAGLELNNKFRLGVGYHFLNSEIVKTISIDNSITNAQVRLRYASISCEYVLLSGAFWQLTAPVIFGFGQSAFVPPSDKFGITEKKFTMFIEPALTFQYNVIPFIGIGTGFGYRFMPAGNNNLKDEFQTPVYDLRIKILLDDVMETIFPGTVKKE